MGNEKLYAEEMKPISSPIIPAEEDLLSFGGKDGELLKRFMQEFFPYSDLKKVGFFTKEMKNDYYAQAKKVCIWLGYKSIFEYGAKEVRCHLTFAGERPEKYKDHITVIPSIYD